MNYNKVLNNFKSFIQKLLKYFIPKYFYHYFEKKSLHSTPYFKVCEKLLDKDMNSIDIGSNIGLFSYFFSLKSKKVFSFEPNYLCYKTFLRRKISNCILHKCALSSKPLSKKLYFQKKNLGCGTLEKENIKNWYNKRNNKYDFTTVEVKKLDDYNFKKISLIKIDVEGHELEVLKGSINTIKKNLPSFLVEIEERHKKDNIKKVLNFFLKMNYKGFFIVNTKILNISKLDIRKYQNLNNKNNIYINNFFFVHKKKNIHLKYQILFDDEAFQFQE